MEDLIKALTIFLKYGNPAFPTNCNHDELWVDIDPEKVSAKDLTELHELGFIPNDEGFISYRFGSC